MTGCLLSVHAFVHHAGAAILHGHAAAGRGDVRARGDGPIRYGWTSTVGFWVHSVCWALTTPRLHPFQNNHKPTRRRGGPEEVARRDDVRDVLCHRGGRHDLHAALPGGSYGHMISQSDQSIGPTHTCIHPNTARTSTGPDGRPGRAGALRRAAPEAQAPDAVRAPANVADAAAGQL